MQAACPRVLLNFQLYGHAWAVHFVEADRTTIGPRTHYYPFADLEALRSFVMRCHPEDATLVGFDHSVRVRDECLNAHHPKVTAVHTSAGHKIGSAQI